MSKNPKKSLENLNQAHGKDESRPVPTTLDQIWGDDGTSKYRTLDVDEYKEELELDDTSIKYVHEECTEEELKKYEEENKWE